MREAFDFVTMRCVFLRLDLRTAADFFFSAEGVLGLEREGMVMEVRGRRWVVERWKGGLVVEGLLVVEEGSGGWWRRGEC